MGVFATLFFAWQQITTFRASQRTSATLKMLEDFSTVSDLLEKGGYGTGNNHRAAQKHNEETIVLALNRETMNTPIDDAHRFAVRISNVLERANDCISENVLDEGLLFRTMDYMILATYVDMDRVFKTMAVRLGAEFSGAKQLAIKAQRHYLDRNGPDQFLREYKIT